MRTDAVLVGAHGPFDAGSVIVSVGADAWKVAYRWEAEEPRGGYALTWPEVLGLVNSGEAFLVPARDRGEVKVWAVKGPRAADVLALAGTADVELVEDVTLVFPPAATEREHRGRVMRAALGWARRAWERWAATGEDAVWADGHEAAQIAWLAEVDGPHVEVIGWYLRFLRGESRSSMRQMTLNSCGAAFVADVDRWLTGSEHA